MHNPNTLNSEPDLPGIFHDGVPPAAGDVSLKALAESGGTTTVQISGLKIHRGGPAAPLVTLQNLKRNSSYRNIVKAIRDAGEIVNHGSVVCF
jgi:hypothetical protein